MQRGKCQKLRRSFWKRIRETAANLQVRSSIFFCFSKRKRWQKKKSLGGDFDFPPDPLEPTKKTASVFLDLSRDSLKTNANSYCPIFYLQDVLPKIFKGNWLQICCSVSGGAYKDASKVTPEWNDA